MWQIGDATGRRNWRVRDTRVGCDLYGVVRTVDGPVAVGDGGTVAADRGTGWEAVVENGPAVRRSQHRAIDATDDGRRVWVVGDEGAIACHDVREGRTYDYGYPTELTDSWTAVAVSGPRGREKVLAADDDGRVLPFAVDGTDPDWGHLDHVGAAETPVAAMASTPEGVGFAVDIAGTAYKTTPDSGWTDIGVVATDVAFGDLYAGPNQQVYVAASDGQIYRYGDAYHSWTPIEVGEAGVRALDVVPEGDGRRRMAALGSDGSVYERVAAERWENVPAPTDARLDDLSLGPTDVLVGENGVVVERTPE